MPRKKGKKKAGRYYFTSEHEDAIVAYARSTSHEEKTDLYVRLIQPAFSEMVNKIVYTYKFSNLPNIDLLMEECKVWLTTILQKYDADRGSKAFSYFSVITKNWFIHKVKQNAQKQRREVGFDDLSKKAESKHFSIELEYHQKREAEEFWSNLWEEINSWDTGNLKENEKKVHEAVKVLLENSQNIEIFNKKAVYLYLRELTGLNTKQVVNSLNKMRVKYRQFKKEWNDGKI
tara:strand:- start:926 stop:1621 length:696 start_codon:yes stop_codon:yes gene_type:complete